jgi:hypothetical protein
MKKNSSSGMMVAGLFVAMMFVSQAVAADLFVTQTGTGTTCTQANSCSLQTALAQATGGETIYLAGGTYTGTGSAVIQINKSISLRGGWNGRSTGQIVCDPNTHVTTLDGEDARSGVYVGSGVIVSIDGFTITHGNGTDNGGSGGGIHINNSTLHVKNCTISENVGSKTGWGGGGGIYTLNSSVDISKSNIVNNTASSEASSFAGGNGGGIYVSGGTAILTKNQVLDNIGQVAYTGSGGGVHLHSVTRADVVNNVIRGNRASLSNWRSDAGGIWIDASSKVSLVSNRIEENMTSGHVSNGSGFGGGVYIWDSEVDLSRNTIIKNSTGTYTAALRPGGGVAIQGSGNVTLINNFIVENNAGPYGGGIYVGIDWPPAGQTLLLHNTIVDNGESAIFVNNYANLTLMNNLLSAHTDGISQINPSNGTISANTNLFWNTSDLIVGDNPIQQDPLLTSNYHLSSSSPAIDAGIDGGVTIDIDGDPRDDGNPDIGADEFSQVNPNKGTIGTEILLYGSDFGAKKGKVLIGGSAPKILEWEDNSIHCQLTKALSPVTYGVTIQPKGLDQIFIEDGFTVKAPKIDSFDPTTGSTGEEITIHGSFFGTKKGKVFLGGKSCKVRSWTMDPVTGESEIRFVVPKGLDSGTNELKVINKVAEDTENFSVD